MPGSDGPRYVDRWRSNGSLVPFTGSGVRSFVFVFEGKAECLTDLCHRYLSAPTGGQVEYRPVTSLVALIFSRVQKLVASNPPYSGMGWFAETEAAFWVLTTAVQHQDDGSAFADHLAWFVPYIFTDSPLAISEGREIFGFPKEFGWFEMPANDDVDRLTVDVHAVRRFNSTDAEGRRERLLEVHRAPDGPVSGVRRRLEAFAEVGRLLKDLWGDSRKLLTPDLNFVSTFLDDVIHHRGQIVCLKQVYDSADTSRACYQAIVEIPLKATQFRAGAVLPDAYLLTLNKLDSHPIQTDLGLEDGERSLLGYSIDFDFEFEPGETIWKWG